MRRVTYIQDGYERTGDVYTLDELIASLTEFRNEYGGDVAVACIKDSTDTTHPLDGLGSYDDEPWGPTINLSIND